VTNFPTFYRRFSLLAVLAIPLGTPERWVHLHYGKVPQNEVTFSASGLALKVDASASPLFYRMAKPVKVTALNAEGSVSDFPTKEPADYALRIGLVTEGTRRLGWFRKLFAPEWLRQLSEIAPGEGFGQVVFYVLSQGKEIGDRRIFSEGEAFEEIVAASQAKPGNFSLTQRLDPPLVVSALWVQADGDDTQSHFTTRLKSLTLEGE